MSKIQHTPGPWHVPSSPYREDSEYREYYVLDARDRCIADCTNLFCVKSPTSISQKERGVNARLIAAVPEMAKALVTCHGFVQPQWKSVCVWDEDTRRANQDLIDRISNVRAVIHAALAKAGANPDRGED